MPTALIGGASRGIGFACARALARTGHEIVMCARDTPSLEASADALRCEAPGKIHIVSCDLASKAGHRTLQAALTDLKLDIDVLVNNIGGPKPGTVRELNEADWDVGIELLMKSTLRAYALVLPGMRARRFGRIINILSTVAVEPVATLAVSSVLRAALAAYAKLTAIDVAADGITVNSVMPGALLTARTEQLLADRAEREGRPALTIRAELEAGFPMHRFLQVEELGRVVAFLASSDASAVSGELLSIDGVQKRSIS